MNEHTGNEKLILKAIPEEMFHKVQLSKATSLG